MPTKKTKLIIKRATSAGGVIFKNVASGIKVALIQREGDIWCLPKGKINKRETAEAAAIREIREETGLKGYILQKIDNIDYWFVSDGSKIHKVVHFYLVRHLGGSTSKHDNEVIAAKWFPIERATGHMTYKSEIKIVNKAGRLIDILCKESK
jgi:8-oxo-dGTP pyrophosphatase MutT (NUDIX family)